jgi:hypothetical protein
MQASSQQLQPPPSHAGMRWAPSRPPFSLYLSLSGSRWFGSDGGGLRRGCSCSDGGAFANAGNLEHCARYLNQTLVTFGFPASLDLFATDPVPSSSLSRPGSPLLHVYAFISVAGGLFAYDLRGLRDLSCRYFFKYKLRRPIRRSFWYFASVRFPGYLLIFSSLPLYFHLPLSLSGLPFGFCPYFSNNHFVLSPVGMLW